MPWAMLTGQHSNPLKSDQRVLANRAKQLKIITLLPTKVIRLLCVQWKCDSWSLAAKDLCGPWHPPSYPPNSSGCSYVCSGNAIAGVWLPNLSYLFGFTQNTTAKSEVGKLQAQANHNIQHNSKHSSTHLHHYMNVYI
jgi:hypothetical protein